MNSLLLTLDLQEDTILLNKGILDALDHPRQVQSCLSALRCCCHLHKPAAAAGIPAYRLPLSSCRTLSEATKQTSFSSDILLVFRKYL